MPNMDDRVLARGFQLREAEPHAYSVCLFGITPGFFLGAGYRGKITW